jgi:hypothetical protein
VFSQHFCAGHEFRDEGDQHSLGQYVHLLLVEIVAMQVLKWHVDLFVAVICRYLTKYERHKFWSEYRRWECIKIFIFKIINVLVLYGVQVNSSSTGTSTSLFLSRFF